MGSRSVGNMLPYGKQANLPRFLVKKISLANPLGGIDNLDKPSALAYEDGYADGRSFGPEGKFIPPHYTIEDIQQYAAGFKAGLKVREHLATQIWSTVSEEVPKASTG